MPFKSTVTVVGFYYAYKPLSRRGDRALLKSFSYFGVYHDNNLTVNIMLENPLDHGLTADALVFCVNLASKDRNLEAPLYEDFSFYIMDEADHIYNVQTALYFEAIVIADDEPVRNYKVIYTGFKPEFVFQDLRVVFFDRTNNKMRIIRLEH